MKQITRGITPDDIYIYKIREVIRVLDGDTIEVLIELGFNIIKQEIIRLLDFDAPETFRPLTEEEKIGGEKVKEYAKSLLLNKDNLYIITRKKGKYGRYLGLIYEKKSNNSLKSINEYIEIFIETNNLTKEELRKSIKKEL